MKKTAWLTGMVMLGVMGLGMGMPMPTMAEEIAQFSMQEQKSIMEVLTLYQQAIELYQQGKYKEGLVLVQQALTILKQQFGDSNPYIFVITDNLTQMVQEATQNQAQETTKDKEALDEAQRLNQQVIELYQQGKYNEAIPLAEQALAIFKKVLGENHPDTAGSLNNLAGLYLYQGRYSEAETLYQQALAIYKQQLGDNHPDTATSLNNLAELYRNQGRYDEAEPRYQEALAIYKQQLGENHPDTATSLNNLAALYFSQGKYTKAEPLYKEALAIYQQQLGENHLYTASSLNNLALLYFAQGRYSEAEPLYKESLAIIKQQLGENHPDTASSLNNLALLYSSQGRYSEAEPLYLQALAINKQQLGENHPLTATSLNNLAELYELQGRYEQSEIYYLHALKIQEKILGTEHPDIAKILKNLSILYQKKGEFQKSQDFYQRYLEVLNKLESFLYSIPKPTNNRMEKIEIKNFNFKIFASNSIKSTPNFFLLTQINNSTDSDSLLIRSIIKTFKIQANHIDKNIGRGDESQKIQFIKELYETINIAITLNFQENLNDAERLTRLNFSLETTLVYKGRILDELTNSLLVLRQRTDDPETKQLLDQIITTTTERSNLHYLPIDKRPSPEIYRQQIEYINIKLRGLQEQLSNHSEKLGYLPKPITLEAIQQQIPNNAALVEIVLYKPYNPKDDSFGNPRYAVYILFPNGEIKAKDLGEAEPINDDLIYFRNNLRDEQTPIQQVKKSSRQLDAKLMQPIRELLGNTKTILLSPDAALNLIPFEALVDENNQYLVENYHITYLTSGRDLLRLKEKFPSEQLPLILADPSYNQEGQKITLNLNRSVDLSNFRFPRLSGTKIEGEAIQKLLPKSTLLTQSQATENALKQVKRPDILHIATHGFFLETTDNNNSQTFENPLLKSGLVLAGVKLNQSAGDDGVLTALETTYLNLVGTKLVVLSACDTGKGDINIGEGVYGLKRALVLAGSESQLISLWKVSDEATKDLMITYYERLKKGEGRSEALRQTQLEMLKSETQNHPFYWASFIPSGDWTSTKF